MTEQIVIAFEDAQRIFDLACSLDNACSGCMDSDDVAAMRRLAVAIGADPAVCTDEEFRAQYPHAFKPGDADLWGYRMNWGAAQETDAQVIERLGGRPETLCDGGGRWKGRCGKPADDPIHQVAEDESDAA
jgi:hypothetical protein